MLTLRHKLTFGFSGLLALLLLVGMLCILLLNQYSSTLEKIFSENYNSVLYSQNMKDVIDAIDDQALQSIASKNSTGEINTLESQNVTLEGEKEIAGKIALAWTDFRADYLLLMGMSKSDTASARFYEERLRPKALLLKKLTQDVIDLNLSNILSTDGRVKENTKGAKQTMVLLLIAGVGTAIALILVTTRSILKPLQIITESAREIERGNLDLSLQVTSRDELGQLAEAFNAMALKLREFRRSDRAQLFRVQKTTQLALNSFPEAVAVIGLDGKIELANELATRRFQLVPGFDLLKSEHKTLWNMFQESFETLAPVHPKGYENAIQMFISGDEYFFLAQTVPILDEAKVLNGVTLVLTDVTNLRRIDESKSGMLSVVSHELKTPLTSIRMATHLLLDERIGLLNDKQLELMIAARDDAERLHRIIENLLDLSRIESGRGSIDLTGATAETLARDALAPFLSMARDQGVTLENLVTGDLPRVLVDRARIPHVFSNLISNALKHTSPGGRIKLSANWHEGDPAVQFNLENTGPEIPDEFHNKIFDRFFRVKGSSHAEGDGVGLGLAIAKDIVNAHGGRIWVNRPSPAYGAQFSFTLLTEAQS
ncbi:MAG: HAMP domain-containing protein [Proteobacteria bacterium]|nr:MAG: HAMP domain-containing protein [Pseudomonadota bacterium]